MVALALARHFVAMSETRPERTRSGESLRMFSWLVFQAPGAPVLFVL
jgi:hypothetical protein